MELWEEAAPVLFSVKSKAKSPMRNIRTVKDAKVQAWQNGDLKERPIIDTSNLEFMNMLGNIDPSYAKHLVDRQTLVKEFMTFNGIDMGNQPICEKCEEAGTWDVGHTCYCSRCHHTTKNPITVFDYLIGERKLTSDQIRLLAEAATGREGRHERIIDRGNESR